MSPRTPHAISFGPTSLRHIKICEVGFPVFAKPFRVPTGVLEDGVEEVNVPVAIGGVRYCLAISLSAVVMAWLGVALTRRAFFVKRTICGCGNPQSPANKF